MQTVTTGKVTETSVGVKEQLTDKNKGLVFPYLLSSEALMEASNITSLSSLHPSAGSRGSDLRVCLQCGRVVFGVCVCVSGEAVYLSEGFARAVFSHKHQVKSVYVAVYLFKNNRFDIRRAQDKV